MKCLDRRGIRSLMLAALILCSVCAGSACAAGSRDLLWNIIGSCLEPGSAGYCSSCRVPLAETPCAAGRGCRDTLEVWAENDAFVALRDRKMCGCPEGFLHGLALPRTRVTGVEDPRRPDGIWSFAWKAACDRNGDGVTTALVVNPAGMRDQDQLHVHIVRLQKDARQRFGKARVAAVQNLSEVWGAAGRVAHAAGLPDYGVLVASRPGGGFLVVVDPESPEKKYCLASCR